MQLTKESIQEFKDIYHKEFGAEVDDIEAEEMAKNLLVLYSLIYKI